MSTTRVRRRRCWRATPFLSCRPPSHWTDSLRVKNIGTTPAGANPPYDCASRVDPWLSFLISRTTRTRDCEDTIALHFLGLGALQDTPNDRPVVDGNRLDSLDVMEGP